MQQSKNLKSSSQEDNSNPPIETEKIKHSLIRTPIDSVLERKHHEDFESSLKINGTFFVKHGFIHEDWKLIVKSIRSHKWKYLKELEVKMEVWGLSETLDKFSRDILSQFVDLQRLGISFAYFGNANEIENSEWELFIYQITRGLQNLKHLKWRFSGIPVEGLQILTEGLCRNKPQLESLDILLQWFNTDGGVLQILTKICRSFKGLKSLCLKFEKPFLDLWYMEGDDDPFDGDGDLEIERDDQKYKEISATMVDIANTISSHLTKLENIRFVIKGMTDIDQELNSVISSIGDKIATLKVLSIEFAKSRLEPVYLLKSLSETFFSASLRNLKRFGLKVARDTAQRRYVKPNRRLLDFEKEENEAQEGEQEDIENKYLEMVGKNLSGLFAHLEHFTFELGGCEGITDEGFIAFISGIQPESPIKHLTLGLERWSLSDKSLEVLGQKIAEDLVNLESLVLDFTDNCDITTEGVEKFITHCQSRTNLKEFTLFLYSCGKINKKDVKRFKKMLKFIPELDIRV